jgi:hypothetical protein
MGLLRRNWPLFASLFAYLLCIIAVNPTGNFPLNDDWSYSRTAIFFGSGKGLNVDAWSAPSLIGQAIYGGLLTKFSSKSFLTLRLSTLVLSGFTAILLWGTVRRLNVRKTIASLFLVAWIFNPLQFSLSFTYMTEIPFIFFIALALYLRVRHVENGKIGVLAMCAASLGYAYLIRQTALFFILGLLCSLLLDTTRDIKTRARQSIIAAVISGIFIAAYYAWTIASGGATAAVSKKFELLDYLTARQIIGNGYGMLFYLGCMLAPTCVFIIPALRRRMPDFRKSLQIGIPAAFCVFIAIGMWWFHWQYTHLQYLPSTSYHARMPYLLNVIYDSGLGPITLDPEYFGPSPTPTYPRVWIVVTLISAIGAVLMLSLCIFSLLRIKKLKFAVSHFQLIVFLGMSFLGAASFEIIFSHLQEGGLFDRHILALFFPFSLLLGLFAHECIKEQSKKPPKIGVALAGIAVAIMLCFSTAATRDYLQWSSIRWNLGQELLRQGVNPLGIAGGFEFNGWMNYDTFVARGNIAGVHHWWHDTRDYLISMSPQEGYEILQDKSYFSWVHRKKVTLYSQKRKV